MLLLPKKSSVSNTVTRIAQSYNQSYTSHRAWPSSHRKANLVVHMEDNQWIIVEPIFFYTRNGRVGTITQTKNVSHDHLPPFFFCKPALSRSSSAASGFFFFGLGGAAATGAKATGLLGS
jgi:hypothetical protein